MGCIREVEYLGPELDVNSLSDSEVAEYARIPVEYAWSAQVVETGIAERSSEAVTRAVRVKSFSECKRIVPITRLVGDLLRRANDVNHGWRVTRPGGAAVAPYVEGRAAKRAHNIV